jgi:hypothetical protein
VNRTVITDCDDPACVNAPNCRNLRCHPTVDFGTLAPGATATVRFGVRINP